MLIALPHCISTCIKMLTCIFITDWRKIEIPWHKASCMSSPVLRGERHNFMEQKPKKVLTKKKPKVLSLSRKLIAHHDRLPNLAAGPESRRPRHSCLLASLARGEDYLWPTRLGTGSARVSGGRGGNLLVLVKESGSVSQWFRMDSIAIPMALWTHTTQPRCSL